MEILFILFIVFFCICLFIAIGNILSGKGSSGGSFPASNDERESFLQLMICDITDESADLLFPF